MISERLSALEPALWQAHPHSVGTAAVAAINDVFSAHGCEISLADYQISYLVPLSPGAAPARIEQTIAGRVYASQLAATEPAPAGGVRVHLPLTVYGDRIGVLTVELDREPDEAQAFDLTAAAMIVARALAVADTRTDIFRRLRRRNRLTLAAEIQWELLPGRACTADEYELAGQLEPAYAVWGDNFDWSAAPDHLTVSVTNGMGQGIDAALLTQLTIGALRNARRSDADLAEQAALANAAIYTQHKGTMYVGTLLLRFDLNTGTVRAIDAGSPQIYRLRNGTVETITLDSQLPLGMFNDTDYAEEEFDIQPGDRLVIVSDGVHDSLDPNGQTYGSSVLPRALSHTRLQNPPEVVRTLTRQLLDHSGDGQLSDDAVIVCLDWTGRPPLIQETPTPDTADTSLIQIS